jgi:hypothetical protein
MDEADKRSKANKRGHSAAHDHFLWPTPVKRREHLQKKVFYRTLSQQRPLSIPFAGRAGSRSRILWLDDVTPKPLGELFPTHRA